MLEVHRVRKKNAPTILKKTSVGLLGDGCFVNVALRDVGRWFCHDRGVSTHCCSSREARAIQREGVSFESTEDLCFATVAVVNVVVIVVGGLRSGSS